ncbi:MAG: S1C family serine protease [Brotaphodocola sp.]
MYEDNRDNIRNDEHKDEWTENSSQNSVTPEPRSQNVEEPNSRNQYGWQPRQTVQQSQAEQQNWTRQPNVQPNRQEHPKKKSSWGVKIAAIAASALLFGVIAGGTMFTVNTLGEIVKGQLIPQTQTETQAQAQVSAAVPQTPQANPVSGQVTSAVVMDVSGIVEQAMPSVVAVHNTMSVEQRTWFGPSYTVEVPSSGSGIIVGQNGEELLIVTNNHVVEDSKELSVTFIDNSEVKAAIKGTDSESDLAVIAVSISDIPAETMGQIKVATLGDSDALKVGQGVIAIGNALGYGQSVTVGYVSALNREVQAEDSTTRTLLQTDAAINPGNSGGALLNMNGEVIGINAAKYSSTEVEGMGYAIPISQAQDIINELMNKKTRVAVDVANQGYLGIQGQNIDESAASMYGMPRGVYVYRIVEDSAASKSDLREKDIITKFDGQTVRSMADLQEMLTYYEGGTTVTLTVQSLENGQYVERNVEITLATRPVTPDK